MTPRLPPVRGRLTRDAPIGKQTWFGVGGPAEVLFRPADAEDLAEFLAALSPEIPVTVIGIGSNLLVRDGGIPGVTVRLGRGCSAVGIEGDQIRAGAAALDRIAAYAAAEAGLGGLEFLSGIPGSVGGSVRMNAGAYGREIKGALVSVTALDRVGRSHTVDCRALRLSYRRSEIDPGWIIVEARLRGTPGDRAAISARLDEIRAAREATQPVHARTGGSTFKNPPGQSAWQLIDAAGCRGLALGGAKVSEQHANFLINTGTATAADLEGLGEEVRRRVYEHSGVMLEWEIERIGCGFPPSPRLGEERVGVSWGESQARSGVETHLTLPRADARGPLPLPPKGGREASSGRWSRGGEISEAPEGSLPRKRGRVGVGAGRRGEMESEV